MKCVVLTVVSRASINVQIAQIVCAVGSLLGNRRAVPHALIYFYALQAGAGGHQPEATGFAGVFEEYFQLLPRARYNRPVLLLCTASDPLGA